MAKHLPLEELGIQSATLRQTLSGGPPPLDIHKDMGFPEMTPDQPESNFDLTSLGGGPSLS